MSAHDIVGWEGAASDAPADLLRRLWPKTHVLRARQGQMVVAHGSAANDVYFVLSGAFEVLITARDGQDVVLRDLGPGAIFGDLAALDGEPRSATVLARTDSSIACVPATEFLQAVSELPEASLWLMRRLGREVRRLTDKIFELSALAVRDRLHCELLRLAAAAGVADGKAVLAPAPTHDALAARIGSQREAVTRELSRLAERGVVERDRRRLVISIDKLAVMVRAELGHAIRVPIEAAGGEVFAASQARTA